MRKFVVNGQTKEKEEFFPDDIKGDFLDTLVSYEIYGSRRLKITFDYVNYTFTFTDKTNKWQIIYTEIPENYCFSIRKGLT